MRLRNSIGILLVFLLFIVGGWSILLGYTPANINDSMDKQELIRFHVIANSDSTVDQKVKLKVRDAVIQYLGQFFEQCQTVDEARKVVLDHHMVIENIAQRVLKQEGMDYPVAMEMGRYDFPLKKYGTLVLPGGKYEAVKLKLGKAQGKNWWCVLFPPLCFIEPVKMIAPELNGKDTVELRWKSIEVFRQLTRYQSDQHETLSEAG